jgi:NHL repeat
MEKQMQKYVQFTFILILFACVAACGGGGSTTAPIQIYDLPVPVTIDPTNLQRHMGGSIQGTSLNLKDGNINTVSTFTGIARSAGFVNFTTANVLPARFSKPNDITTDGINFYVADFWNNAIRKVTPTGAAPAAPEVRTLPIVLNRPSGITTIDGTTLYVVANGANAIWFINTNDNTFTTIGSITGLAGSVDSTVPEDVRFNQPTGITTDGENLYVTDSGNHTIRRINITTKAVSTLAGSSGAVGSDNGIQGAARFNLPWRITTDGANLYVTDFRNHTIRRIDILTGTVFTIAGSPGPLSLDGGATDGIGTDARFNQPNGITTDGINLFVTDSYQNTIRKIVIDTKAVTTISGIPKLPGDKKYGQGGSVDSPGAPSFDTPIGITTDGTGLYIADSVNSTIRKIQ